MKSVDFPADTRYGRIYFKNPERESYMKNKKKLFGKTMGLIAALVLCFGMTVLAAPSVTGDTELTVQKDKIVSASYKITNDDSIESVKLTLSYDKSDLTYMSGSGGDNFSGSGGNGLVELSSNPGSKAATFGVKFKGLTDGTSEVTVSSCTITVNGKEIDALSGVSLEEEEEEKTDASAEDEEEEEDDAPKPINQIHPLWTKNPNDCTDEEYKEFYRDVFHDYKEPLFWIHLNMDYPFNLKGILYFPKINTKYDTIEGTIKLYNNQVFIADNIKEVIPEYLLLLKGCIDCPDLPLNVSRSALQNDGFVKKISNYITKKVAEKLSGMCKTDRENYEKYWDDISPFIKFGCIRDQKFNDKMKDYIIFKNMEGKYVTLPDYLEAGKEKYENNVFYITDEVAQSQYINMFKEQEIDAIYLTHQIDTTFITHLEQRNPEVKFLRIDSELTDNFKETIDENEEKELTEKLSEKFKKATGVENLIVKVEKLKNADMPSMITVSEQTRRMSEMMEMYGMSNSSTGLGAEGETLVLNMNNDLVQYVLNNDESENTTTICQQLYDLARLANHPLKPEEMTAFVARSNKILSILTK